MSAKGVIGSVIITLAIVVALGYYVLPMAYPNITAKDKDVVVQQKYVEFYTVAFIVDTNTSNGIGFPMNGTEMDITTQGNSSLLVQFDADFQVDYNLPVSQAFGINLTLGITGIGNKSQILQYYNNNPGQTNYNGIVPFSLKYMTGTLLNGTYHVAMYWNSQFPITGGQGYVAANYCVSGIVFGPFTTGNPYNASRSLLAEEIANP